MTSIFNFSSTSSSNPAINLNGESSLLSHLKYPTTFIIQPPSSSQIHPTTLLAKRCKPAELGDLLMKKIKTQSSNVSDNNSQPSPLIREAYEDAIYDSSEGLECRSIIEEPRSPSTKSYNEDSKVNQQKMIEELLMPQRSLSTPLVTSLNFSAKDRNSQRQLQNALETLQKRIVLDQQTLIIKNILQRAKLAEPLMIPPLQATADRSISSLKINEPERPIFKSLEGEPEIFVGEIEYPLLSLVPGGSESLQKNLGFPSMSNVTIPKRGKKGLAKLSMESSPVSDLPRHNESLFESLAATRAETQRSDSETSEEYGKVAGRKRKGQKSAVEKVKKSQKKEEKTKGKRQQKKEELLLSPLVKSKKMSERKMNKWQKETDKQKEDLII